MHPLSHRKRLRLAEKRTSVSPCYRGSNDAWDGYGGAVVYSTKPALDPAYDSELSAIADKAGSYTRS